MSESKSVVVEMIVESREDISASDHDWLKLRGPMLAEIPIIEAMVDCTCDFKVGDKIAIRFTRIEEE